MTKNIIIAITGASGAIYGIRALELLKQIDNIKTHLVISNAGKITINQETNYNVDDVKSLADCYYSNKDIGARIACGSHLSDGMLIAPCSINTMSSLAHGITNNLVTRSADVCLKERRKVIIMLRETPLHIGHIKSMELLTNIGAIIAPPVPALYQQPKSIDDLINYTISRNLELLGIKELDIARWEGIIPSTK